MGILIDVGLVNQYIGCFRGHHLSKTGCGVLDLKMYSLKHTLANKRCKLIEKRKHGLHEKCRQ